MKLFAVSRIRILCGSMLSCFSWQARFSLRQATLKIPAVLDIHLTFPGYAPVSGMGLSILCGSTTPIRTSNGWQ